MHNNHRVTLPAWGPYTKKYVGISHVPDEDTGWRFDLSVFPGLYRRKVKLPSVLIDSDYHPWAASQDLSYYSHRHVIDEKSLFCDISFANHNDQYATVQIEAVNETSAPEALVLHYMSSVHFPPAGSHHHPVSLRPCIPHVPDGGVWINASDYDWVDDESAHPFRHLSWNGLKFSETYEDDCVEGRALSCGDPGTFKWAIADDVSTCGMTLLIRYKLQGKRSVDVEFADALPKKITLSPSDAYTVLEVSTLDPDQTLRTLSMSHKGSSDLSIDGFAIIPTDQKDALRFEMVNWDPVPEIVAKDEEQRFVILKYKNVEHYYGIGWDGSVPSEVRQFFCEELDTFLPRSFNDHVHSELFGPGEGHFTNIFQRPIPLAPNSRSLLNGMVCQGTLDAVQAQLKDYRDRPEAYWVAHKAKASGAFHMDANSAGKPYQFGIDKMAATVQTGVVYPIRCRGIWTKHYTPGRYWDSLYTWDSGFTALGLAEVQPDRAYEHLNAYLVDEKAPDQSSFIEHGTPLPVQIYAFKELWNKAPDLERLKDFFPRLRNMHRFLVGRYPHSTTNRLQSGLITTWDYFYNSGGWDDYCPQVHVHRNKLTDVVAPIVNTAHAIRTAKILRAFALLIDEPVAEFDEDIKECTAAILEHGAWDEQTGYFGYLMHDAEGKAEGILRHESGIHFNMGMDGVSPLVAGIGDEAQKCAMRANLLSPDHLWTPIGLSTVDQSAPYFREDGYWNGAVWMPHQWFFWKALLDEGDTDGAYLIAETALRIWNTEVERSYNCYEHFIVATGRGAGWHQFSGLSCPVLSWFNAYFQPGTISVGHSVTVLERNAKGTQFCYVTDVDAPKAVAAIITLEEGLDASATIDGKPVELAQRHPGTWEIRLPYAPKSVSVMIETA